MQIISSFDDQISKAISEGWFPDRSISVRQLIAEGTPLEKHDIELLEKLDKALYDRFHDENNQTNTTIVSLGAIRNFVRNFSSEADKTKAEKKIEEEIDREF